MLVICRQIVVATHVRECRELLRVVMVARRHWHGRVEVRVVVPGVCGRLLAVQLAVVMLVRVRGVGNRLMVVLVVPGIRRRRAGVLTRNPGRSGATDNAFDRPPRGSRPHRARGRRRRQAARQARRWRGRRRRGARRARCSGKIQRRAGARGGACGEDRDERLDRIDITRAEFE